MKDKHIVVNLCFPSNVVVNNALVETRFVGTYILAVSGEYFGTHLDSINMTTAQIIII